MHMYLTPDVWLALMVDEHLAGLHTPIPGSMVKGSPPQLVESRESDNQIKH